MATVAQLAKSSLQRIIVKDSDAELEADDLQDFMFSLNNYMFALDANGITLGFTEVSSLGDEVTVPLGALRGIIANMAIEVAPDYGSTVTPALQLAASQGMKAMEKLGVIQPISALPATLPIGSGNSGGSFGGLESHFYPDSEAEILAETTGAISLESGTAAATP